MYSPTAAKAKSFSDLDAASSACYIGTSESKTSSAGKVAIMATYCTAIRNGSKFIISLHDGDKVLFSRESEAQYLEHAEADALAFYPEAVSVNGIDRPGHMKFTDVPADGKIPHEKARVQKPLDSDDCAGV